MDLKKKRNVSSTKSETSGNDTLTTASIDKSEAESSMSVDNSHVEASMTRRKK